MNDNTSDLEELRIDRQRAAMMRGEGASGGGRTGGNRFRDSRLTIIIGIVGAIMSGLGITALSKLFQMSEDVAVIKTTMSAQNQMLVDRVGRVETRLDGHDERLNNAEQHIYTLEGKAMRGAPEARRGN